MWYSLVYMIFILAVAWFSFTRGYYLGKEGKVVPFVKKKIKTEKSREEQILDNIEKYDGTNTNQRPVRG